MPDAEREGLQQALQQVQWSRPGCPLQVLLSAMLLDPLAHCCAQPSCPWETLCGWHHPRLHVAAQGATRVWQLCKAVSIQACSRISWSPQLDAVIWG